MYQNKIHYSPQDILDKEFKIDTRGFRMKEVDLFLDDIIEDYEEFYSIINNLEKDKAELIGENMHLKQEIRTIKANVEIAENENVSNNANVTNVDILRRLSKLEKMVYEKDN